MAKKRQEIALQRELETQEEWEECLAMEGLWVVDVYQEWCGPCQALQGSFRRLKNELGDPLLQFAIAKADTIDALEQYRGRCEPTFLFYAGGILVAFIHGANAPKVQRTITEQLAQEHKVMEGQGERKEVKDVVMSRSQEKEIAKKEQEEADRELQVPKGTTLAIIKPDAVAAGKTDEIIKELQEKGIEIVAQEDRELTDDEARELYQDLSDEDYFESLLKFITSGPSHLLVLTAGETGETVVTDVRDLLGPKNVEEAKEEAPDSLRAKYGEQGYMNALHASSSEEMAAKEMAFFFPTLALPTYLKKKENIQRTLALIRPEAFSMSKDEILEKIKEAGFKVALYKEVQLTKDQCAEFYKEHEGSAYFEQLCDNMSSGPLLALGLARDEAIDVWREMLGPANIDDAQEQAPDSMRAKYSTSSGVNQFHGSSSVEQASKEIEFFFPMQETVAVIKPSAMGTKDAIIEKIHEAGFRIAAHKETTITKEIVDIMYPNYEEKEFYEDLVNSMTSGDTMFMVLTREGAVDGWRHSIGATDPESAKASNPDSIRAQFGQDILNNAVHGASNPAHAKSTMKAVFGDLQFNPDGTVKGEEPQLDEATVGETTMDDTTMPDTTITADTTADITAGDATVDTTVAADEPAAQPDPTEADTTAGDTTMDETTAADTTVPDSTVADTTTADGTATETETATEAAAPEPATTEPAATEESAPTEQAPETGGETATETAAETETATETATETTVPESTVPDTTVDETTAGEEAAEPEATEQQVEKPTEAPAETPAEAPAESQAEEKPATPAAAQEEQAPEAPAAEAVEQTAQEPKADEEPAAPAEDKPSAGDVTEQKKAEDTTIGETTAGETTVS